MPQDPFTHPPPRQRLNGQGIKKASRQASIDTHLSRLGRVAMILVYGAFPPLLLVLGLAAVHHGVVVLLLHGDVAVVAALLQAAQQLVALVQRGLEKRIYCQDCQDLSGLDKIKTTFETKLEKR